MAAIQPVLLFIRKNFLSLLCAVIAIGALVVLYWPISNWFTDFQQQADQRKAAYSAINMLLTKPRTLPLLDPFSTQPVPLNQFPTQPVYDRASIVTKDIADEATKMLDAAKGAVIHRPLTQDALPNGGTKEATEFREKYQEIMSFPNLDPDKQKLTLPVTIMHATMPPSAADITAAQDAIKTQLTKEETQTDASGSTINADKVAADVADAQAALPDIMRAKAANENKLYIAPDAIHINPNLTGVSPPSDITMFHAQTTLWLLQDIFTAIAATNELPLDPAASATQMSASTTQPMQSLQSMGIEKSIVKHLLKVVYSDNPLTPSGTSYDPNAPAAATADPLHPANNPAISPTGHVSNGLYDVVPFSLSMIVDAACVPDVLTTLSKNRFITVLKTDIGTVDSGQALLAGFIYGSRPVVKLDLSCEELFFRQETSLYMPDVIKKVLGVAPPAAPPTP